MLEILEEPFDSTPMRNSRPMHKLTYLINSKGHIWASKRDIAESQQCFGIEKDQRKDHPRKPIEQWRKTLEN